MVPFQFAQLNFLVRPLYPLPPANSGILLSRFSRHGAQLHAAIASDHLNVRHPFPPRGPLAGLLGFPDLSGDGSPGMIPEGRIALEVSS
jgi:hypothetical protein